MKASDENPTAPNPTRQSGYGRPPEATRFRKGQSGNRKGRPKGSLNVATVLVKALREKVVITENGRRRTVTKLEAAAKQLANKAASGELRALRLSIDLARDIERQQNVSTTQDSIMGDLDHEVISVILKRFNQGEEQAQARGEAANHDDQPR
jgi:hypothetical protein